ncbi:MAG: hypothetical protein JKY27_12620 [Magnetovibrio sp.]|nr:hypothetical protein [Magnetovibrio sp.]
MADTGKLAWPRKADGTTDWEVVFEDPNTGFIQLVAKSPSPEVLRQATTIIIDKLFTRRGDKDEVINLKNQLESILSNPGDIASKQVGVGGLLRQIKETRVDKARDYIERKLAGAAIDRRAGLLWKIDFLLKPKVLLPVGFAFILLISGFVFVLLQTTLGPSDPTIVAEAPADVEIPVKDQENPAELQPAEDLTQAPEALPSDVEEPDDIKEPEPIRIFLKTLRWPLSSMSTKERPQYFSVILYVDDWDTKIQVCRRVANVMDKLYLAFNFALPQDRKARDIELAELAGLIPSAVNQIYGTELVVKSDVYRYGQQGFKSAPRPPYCNSPDKP